MEHKIPLRSETNPNDTWDLEVLFSSRQEWDEARERVVSMLPRITEFESQLKEDASQILELYTRLYDMERNLARLYAYAYLSHASDSSDNTNQELIGTAQSLLAQINESTAFIEEEVCSLPEEFLTSLIEDSRFKHLKHNLVKLLRRKSHILSKQEEILLAQQSEYVNGFHESFNALSDVDIDFGEIETPEGTVSLSHANYSVLMEHTDREIRKKAQEQFLSAYQNHQYTFSSLYASSIKQDKAMAKIRKFKSTLEAKLYSDNIPEGLYRDLIRITHEHLPTLHKYYRILKKKSKLDDFATYDTPASFYPAPNHDMAYDEAVELLVKALSPLGEEYTSILNKGLTTDRWVDKYENKGKRSGAFSSSICYDNPPYILINYKSKSLRQLLTIAHEAGHSMHSYYAKTYNEFPQHSYTIFEAEVASTLNEYLTYKYLIENSDDDTYKVYLLWQELQDFIATFFRQVMFAEFELYTHEHSEAGKPLTSEYFQTLFSDLNKKYYGEQVRIPEFCNIVGLRIPHFYFSFYVYKYATGIAAAYDIASRIYNKEEMAVEKYFDFLKSGGSRFPVDALKLAGVDYSTPKPIVNALEEFKKKCDLLESLS